ncbi:MAG: hypothetical protein HC934_08535 [Acaryochloridaceae cyanobacterium SU_2_1]|nr:hypothetical protein [Acaryochloridaceae cyanobacterium SU_2_1]
MRRTLLKLLVIGCCLSACELRANEITPPLPPEQSQIEALQLKFEQEMKAELARKSIDNYSFNEIAEIASKVNQKVYGPYPQLMKQKVLFDIQQLPELDSQVLSNYQAKESLNVAELLKGSPPLPNPQAKGKEDLLSIFYGRKPASVANNVKSILWARYMSAKHLGQRAIISSFLPDKTYRMQSNGQLKLVVKTFEDDLFVISVQVSELGLLKPLKADWMQLKVSPSTIRKS